MSVLSDAHQRRCVIVNETKVSHMWRLRRDQESCQGQAGCRVCSWRVSLWLGLGGEAELPQCHIAGLDWHCHLGL